MSNLLTTLTLYANPPTNYLGTALFLSYILFALYFTSSIALSLYQKFTALKRNGAPKNAKDTRILFALASLSFAALSYHMLKFLLISYARWNLSRSFFGARSDPNTNTGTGLAGDEFGDANGDGILWNRIYHWMLSSTLFETFAKELVSDAPSTLVTQVALLGTWFWDVWIAGKAAQRKIPRAEMTKYIALSQILPITFTTTLFLLDLELSSSSSSSTTSTSTPSSSSSSSTTSTPRKSPTPANTSKSRQQSPKALAKRRAATKLSFTIRTILFNITLLVLPTFAHTSRSQFFIPCVLVTRIMILLPHLSALSPSQTMPSDDDWFSALTLSLGFVVANASLLAKGTSILGVADVLWRGPSEAVKAVGWDVVLGGVVAGWRGMRR